MPSFTACCPTFRRGGKQRVERAPGISGGPSPRRTQEQTWWEIHPPRLKRKSVTPFAGQARSCVPAPRHRSPPMVADLPTIGRSPNSDDQDGDQKTSLREYTLVDLPSHRTSLHDEPLGQCVEHILVNALSRAAHTYTRSLDDVLHNSATYISTATPLTACLLHPPSFHTRYPEQYSCHNPSPASAYSSIRVPVCKLKARRIMPLDVAVHILGGPHDII